MKKEELLNSEFETKIELIDRLVEFSEFEKASELEKDEWPYKSELFISLKNVIGNELFIDNKLIGVIEDCFFGNSLQGHKSVRMKVKDKEYSITGAKIKMYDKFGEQNILVDLHPSRKGIKFWSYGYIISEKDYKSLYYKTREYRGGFEKTLNKNYGTIGLTSPVQIKEVRDKISKTIEENYGVKWFLNRGCHYSAVTNTMQEKFGVDNLFYSDEWQNKNSRTLGIGISNIEQEIVEFINHIIKEEKPKTFHNSMYYGEKVNQASVQDLKRKRTYRVDFLNDKLKIIIDINGDYWHCNPKTYDSEYYHSHKKMLAKDIWKADKERIDSIKRITNYRHLIIWESDWKKIQDKIKEVIKKFINEKK